MPLGDRALTLWLDAAPGPRTTGRLSWIARRLREQAPAVVDVAASFASLTVHVDGDAETLEAVAAQARALAQAAPDDPPPGRLWRLPVCFDADLGLDQQEVRSETGLDPAAVIDLLAAAPVDVLAVGFLPGFPFCGPAPAPLALKRKASPRLRVPRGSVAVANGFIGVYPWVSPGGWRVLGASNLPLFDAAQDRPALLAAGDRLRIEPVDRAAHDALAADPPPRAAFLLEDAA